MKLKVLMSSVLILFGAYFAVGFYYKSSTKDKPYEYGASFSSTYAESLGLDWQDAYLALLDDLDFKKLRLMSYWNLHEPTEGEYDFTSLDWQIEQAEQRDVEVLLVVGARQPRWPECHIPEWANQLESDDFDDSLLGYIETTVSRYKSSSAIKQWQVENEPRNVVFSTCRPYFNKDRLQKEFDLVKSLDPSREIYMTLSTEFQLPISGAIGDKVGYSIYEEVNASVGSKRVQWQHIIPSSWHSFRSGTIKLTKNRPTYIHELQAEPWGHDATINMTPEEQSRSMTPEKLQSNLGYAKETGNKLIYFWGAEWWYWQKTTNDNPAMWQTTKDLLK